MNDDRSLPPHAAKLATDDGQGKLRRTRKKRETRDRLLDATRRLLDERDFDDIRVEEITALADFAPATFFLHFSTKAALLNALMEEMIDTVCPQLEALPEDSPTARLFAMPHLFSAYWKDHRRAMGRVFLAIRATERPDQNAMRPVVRLIEETLRQGRAAGEFREDRHSPLAAALLANMWRVAAQYSTPPYGAGHGMPLHDEATDLFLNGLRLRPGTDARTRHPDRS